MLAGSPAPAPAPAGGMAAPAVRAADAYNGADIKVAISAGAGGSSQLDLTAPAVRMQSLLSSCTRSKVGRRLQSLRGCPSMAAWVILQLDSQQYRRARAAHAIPDLTC